MEKSSEKKTSRIILITICILVFGGMLLYSALGIRYQVSGQPKSEMVITELSLSHSVIRGDDGALELKEGSLNKKGGRRPCPT